MKRQLPKRHDLAPLLKFKRAVLVAHVTVGWPAALTIEDLRRIAKRRTPKAAFDYTDGAADGEVSLARARQAFADVEFHPAILRDVSDVDTSREVLGKQVALPFGIAPTGFTRMMQAEGEIAGATAAGAAGIPFSPVDDGHHLDRGRRRGEPGVATAATGSSSTCGRTATGRWRWSTGPAQGRLRHAAGHRRRPGRRRPAARRTQRDDDPADPVARAPWPTRSRRPAWWFNFLTTEPLAFASLDAWSGTVAELLDTMFDPTVTYDDLAWIRDQWPGKVVVKGVQTVEDSLRLADAGVDAILLSNHGGRQLDRAPIPFHLLPDVVKAVGSGVEVHVDTGIMSGQDIVAAIAHGARFTLVGRAYLYGLMAGGREGVDRTIEILRGQIERTMRLLGVRTLDELEPGHVTQLVRLEPRSR